MARLIFRTAAAAVAFLWAMPAVAQGMGPMTGPGLLGGSSQPPVSSQLLDGLREPEDQMRAKGLKECKVGDRVRASHEGRWLSAQVIEVNPDAQYPCKVHLIGRPPSMDASFAAWMLRPDEVSP